MTDVERKIRALAKQFLAGELDICEVAGRIGSFILDINEQNDELKNIVERFHFVFHEFDAIPLGEVRRFWNPAALESKDKEQAEIEGWWREQVIEDAEKIIFLLDNRP